MRCSWLVLVALLVPGPGAAGDEPAAASFHDDPIATYERREAHGFTVLISRRLADHPAEAAAAWGELEGQLGRVAATVPARPLAELRKVRIWLERAETAGLGEFHWGPEPLVAAGRNPAKARDVEITNAGHLVEWAPIQPWAVLHELAHAYHCRVLGRDHPGLRRAFDAATRSGRYDRVAYAQGGTRRAYALTDPPEYFAELTEAYFGRNDFEPADRAALARFDPAGDRLMVETWGEPAPAPSRPPADPPRPGSAPAVPARLAPDGRVDPGVARLQARADRDGDHVGRRLRAGPGREAGRGG